jgi:hypothetical protein
MGKETIGHTTTWRWNKRSPVASNPENDMSNELLLHRVSLWSEADNRWYPFLGKVDTGSPYCIISSYACNQLGLHSEQRDASKKHFWQVVDPLTGWLCPVKIRVEARTPFGERTSAESLEFLVVDLAREYQRRAEDCEQCIRPADPNPLWVGDRILLGMNYVNSWRKLMAMDLNK